MKITSAAARLFGIAIATGILTYFSTAAFKKFYLELLPIIIFSLLCLAFFVKQLRMKYSKIETVTVLIISYLLIFLVYYIIAEIYPLAGMKPIGISEHFLRGFMMIGISVFSAVAMWVIASLFLRNHQFGKTLAHNDGSV